MMGTEVHLHTNCQGDSVVMVIPTVDLAADISNGATVRFTTQPRLMQLFDRESGNNLIWYDAQSAKENAPVSKSYPF